MKREAYIKPDFIGIGPPKTGTTWIYHNLSTHPQVVMPPDKEIRYFWERCFVGTLSLKQWLRSDNWHVRGRRAYHKNRFRSHLSSLLSLKLNFGELFWDLKYLPFNRCDKWYSSLFTQDGVSGDISAKYCELPEIEIARIANSFPQLKVIITLRDPIEREWSRAKMNLSKKPGRELSEVAHQEFIDQFNDPPQKAANDYAFLIETWQRAFGSNRIIVLFYDELLENPFTYFTRLCDFLAIAPPQQKDRDELEKYVFKGVKGEIPDAYRSVLFQMHEKNIQRLIDYFPHVHYPKDWMKAYSSQKGQ